MKVSQGNSIGFVTVDYSSTHHNHNHEDDIRVPEDLRVSIAAKLLQGIIVEKILDDIRDSVSEKGLQREHLTTRQDVLNAKWQYNTEGIERHANDQTSVSALVEEMRSMDFDPVIVFKQQGVTNDEKCVAR